MRQLAFGRIIEIGAAAALTAAAIVFAAASGFAAEPPATTAPSHAGPTDAGPMDARLAEPGARPVSSAVGSGAPSR